MQSSTNRHTRRKTFAIQAQTDGQLSYLLFQQIDRHTVCGYLALFGYNKAGTQIYTVSQKKETNFLLWVSLLLLERNR